MGHGVSARVLACVGEAGAEGTAGGLWWPQGGGAPAARWRFRQCTRPAGKAPGLWVRVSAVLPAGSQVDTASVASGRDKGSEAVGPGCLPQGVRRPPHQASFLPRVAAQTPQPAGRSTQDRLPVRGSAPAPAQGCPPSAREQAARVCGWPGGAAAPGARALEGERAVRTDPCGRRLPPPLLRVPRPGASTRTVAPRECPLWDPRR